MDHNRFEKVKTKQWSLFPEGQCKALGNTGSACIATVRVALDRRFRACRLFSSCLLSFSFKFWATCSSMRKDAGFCRLPTSSKLKMVRDAFYFVLWLPVCPWSLPLQVQCLFLLALIPIVTSGSSPCAETTASHAAPRQLPHYLRSGPCRKFLIPYHIGWFCFPN